MAAVGPELADLLDGAPRSAAATVDPDNSGSDSRVLPDVDDLLDGTVDVVRARHAPRATRPGSAALAALRGGALLAAPALLIALVLVVAWEAWVRARDIPQYLAPTPSAVAETLIADPSRFLEAGAVSLQHALGGLLLGAGSAFLLGIAMAHSRLVERALYPYAIVVKVTPVVAVAPLLAIWLGFGDSPKYVVAGLITFFPMLVNAVTGLRAVDASALDYFRSMHASRWRVLWRLRLPASLPYVFAALRISIPLALIGAVVAEWMSADSGVGQVIVIAHGDFDTPALFGAILVLAAIGVGLTVAVALLERRMLFWHDSTRR
jgi:NitT/TauT family transport system permease protein